SKRSTRMPGNPLEIQESRKFHQQFLMRGKSERATCVASCGSCVCHQLRSRIRCESLICIAVSKPIS
ncbi:hypothetical protein, partial [Xanthomonas oryzae]